MSLPERFELEFGGMSLRGERFRPAHVPAVLALERACFPSPWSRQLLLEEARAGQHAWNLVVHVNGRVEAFFFNWTVLDEMHLLNFAVHPRRQGRGLGGFILDWMLARAGEAGYHVVHLEVRESNLPAIELYRSRGFNILFRRQGYYSDNGEDALIMMRELGPASQAEGTP